MEKLKIELKNCYGIRHFADTFDFSKKSAYAVYASNGAMKTSFANTFKDLSKGEQPKERHFGRKSNCKVTVDNIQIDPQTIFVIDADLKEPEFSGEKATTLLVDKDLRKKYEQSRQGIEKAKDELLEKLKKNSGLTDKGKIEKEIIEAFHGRGNLFKAIENAQKEIKKEQNSAMSDVSYKEIFGDDRIVQIIEKESFREKIGIYIGKFNELIERSPYLRDQFDYNNLVDIKNALKTNKYFDAGHFITLKSKNTGAEDQEIVSAEDFEVVINQEIEQILSDADLRKAFEEINKELSGAQYKEKFRSYLRSNKSIIPELENVQLLKKNLWLSYFNNAEEQFSSLVKEYSEKRSDMESIVSKATQSKNQSKWQSVVRTFNQRFSTMPFRVDIDNSGESILGIDVPNIIFIFVDEIMRVTSVKPKNELYGYLSSGEKRALYLLDIIFEIENRKEAEQETLFIVDDVVDSFDYKNKYAIISYLNDIARGESFYQIILTHNFDFFRILKRRGVVDECRMIKTNNNGRIELVKAKYVEANGDPFQAWKQGITEGDNIKLVASIPFARNIVEYINGKDGNEYKELTKLLHIKEDSSLVTIGELQTIYKEIFNIEIEPPNPENDENELVIDLIFKLADDVTTSGGIELENKIILSMATRLKAEEYIQSQISGDKEFEQNQTRKLIEQFLKEFGDDDSKEEAIEVLEDVQLMTPEGIHLNTFMYEPIIDMSIDNLKNLYSRVVKLQAEG